MMSVMSARPLVVVLDTNVVIAALLWSGPPWAILVRATDGEGLILATSPALLAELSDTLATPRFRKRIADAGTSVKELVAAYRRSFHRGSFSTCLSHEPRANAGKDAENQYPRQGSNLRPMV
jgi:putative PIN family toxin of toxin-antitoxin system